MILFSRITVKLIIVLSITAALASCDSMQSNDSSGVPEIGEGSEHFSGDQLATSFGDKIDSFDIDTEPGEIESTNIASVSENAEDDSPTSDPDLLTEESIIDSAPASQPPPATPIQTIETILQAFQLPISTASPSPSPYVTPAPITTTETDVNSSITPTPTLLPGPSPTSEPSPAPLPPAEPSPEPAPTTAPTILFSYSNDINTAELLEHATVRPQQVYFFTQGAAIQSITYFCCHSLFTMIQDTPELSLNKDTPPFAMSIDLAQFTDHINRELHFEYIDSDNKLHANNTVQFDLDSAPISTPPSAYSANVTLSWHRPQFREDGQLLNADDIAGYSVHYADSDENDEIYFFSGGTLTWKTQLFEGIEYQFAIRTIDRNGLESKLSKTIQCSISQLNGLACY